MRCDYTVGTVAADLGDVMVLYITLFGGAAAELEKYVPDKKMAPIKGPYLEFTLHLFVHLFHLFHRVVMMVMVMVMVHWLCHGLRIFCACD